MWQDELSWHIIGAILQKTRKHVLTGSERGKTIAEARQGGACGSASQRLLPAFVYQTDSCPC